MQDQRAELEWRDGGVPVSRRFDDPYFSLENGLAETQHVFLAGNGLPDRFVPGFRIAELGFGTGLNFLVAWSAWKAKQIGGTFYFTSFEAFPMSLADMEKAHAAFPELAEEAAALCALTRNLQPPRRLAQLVDRDVHREGLVRDRLARPRARPELHGPEDAIDRTLLLERG